MNDLYIFQLLKLYGVPYQEYLFFLIENSSSVNKYVHLSSFFNSNKDIILRFTYVNKDSIVKNKYLLIKKETIDVEEHYLYLSSILVHLHKDYFPAYLDLKVNTNEENNETLLRLSNFAPTVYSKIKEWLSSNEEASVLLRSEVVSANSKLRGLKGAVEFTACLMSNSADPIFHKDTIQYKNMSIEDIELFNESICVITEINLTGKEITSLLFNKKVF